MPEDKDFTKLRVIFSDQVVAAEGRRERVAHVSWRWREVERDGEDEVEAGGRGAGRGGGWWRGARWCSARSWRGAHWSAWKVALV